MGPIVIGIFLIGIGIVLIFVRRKKQDQLLEIKATKTSTARDLTDMCKSISEELGTTGGFKQQVEVKGVVKCDNPLCGEMSKEPCVYFEVTVTEQRQKSDGTWERNTVSRNSRCVNFYVQDETGSVWVNPNDAKIDPLPAISLPQNNQIFTEKIIPLDRKVYVLGEAADSSGQLMIQAPSETGKPFIITLKSEEEMTKATASTIGLLMTGIIIFWLIGAGFLIYGLFHP